MNLSTREQLLVNRQVILRKAAKKDLVKTRVLIYDRAYSVDGNMRGMGKRESINACADVGKSDCHKLVVCCDFKRTPVTGCQLQGFVLFSAVPYRAHCVDDIAGWEPIAKG